MTPSSTAEIIAEIAREREALRRILVERNFHPLKALEFSCQRQAELRQAALGSEPGIIGLGLEEVRSWFESGVDTLQRSKETQDRINEFSKQVGALAEVPFDPNRPEEAAGRAKKMEQIIKEARVLEGRLDLLLRENEGVRQSVEHVKVIGSELDSLFARAEAGRPVVRRAQFRQLWLRVLFVTAAFAGALAVGMLVNLFSEHLLLQPLSSLAFVGTSLAAFVLEALLVGRPLDQSQEALHWQLYERLLSMLEEDLSAMEAGFARLSSLVKDSA